MGAGGGCKLGASVDPEDGTTSNAFRLNVYHLSTKGGAFIPTIFGNLSGLKANQLAHLERLYRRRIPIDKVVTPEVGRECAELSHAIRRQVGVLISRRGGVEYVIVGSGRDLLLPDLSEYRVGRRLLRGVRLVHTHLHNEPLTQDDLTDLALLRLDLMAAIGVGNDGQPKDIFLAHILPPNPQGRMYEEWSPVPFHTFRLHCDEFVTALEDELTKGSTTWAVKEGKDQGILVSVSTRSRLDQEERLLELAELARSDDIEVLEMVCQRPHEIHPKYLLGSGKLKELVIKALQRGADLLIFDQDLTPTQVKAIGEVTDMKVIDRTQLILDIFARRARSREGKIQVELAQLRYVLPRLSERSTALSRLGGGIGGRGPGETKLETDRRRVRDRIAHLERELQAHAKRRNQQRAHRFRRKVPIVSIVGYTNAGKSTLLNALTASHVSVENRLFETLDTVSRRLRFPYDREVILTDTVGFIRDLPKDLLGAFRATLEELRDADLLLHVVDVSAKDLDHQMESVEAILSKLDLQNVPRTLVLNKCDRLTVQEVHALCRRYGALGISAHHPETLIPLIELLERFLADFNASQKEAVLSATR